MKTLMVKDSEAKQKMIREILELVRDDQRLEKLRQNIGKYAITDADEKVAGEILKTIAQG